MTSKNKPWELLEGIVELKFELNIPEEILLGILYEDLIKRYPVDMKNLPIAQFPEAVRKIDPNLKYVPYYQFSNDDFMLELGPRVIIIRNHPSASGQNYKGWKKYKEEITFMVGLINKHKFIKKYDRIGIRYVNFFESLDIFLYIKLKVDLSSLIKKNVFLGIQTVGEGFDGKIQIASGIKVINPNFEGEGSIIDIDVSKENLAPESNIEKFLDDGHDLSKKILFDKILTEEYIQSTKQ
jgi:uncharacterized protein (TIGR04255 family)